MCGRGDRPHAWLLLLLLCLCAAGAGAPHAMNKREPEASSASTDKKAALTRRTSWMMARSILGWRFMFGCSTSYLSIECVCVVGNRPNNPRAHLDAATGACYVTTCAMHAGMHARPHKLFMVCVCSNKKWWAGKSSHDDMAYRCEVSTYLFRSLCSIKIIMGLDKKIRRQKRSDAGRVLC